MNKLPKELVEERIKDIRDISRNYTENIFPSSGNQQNNVKELALLLLEEAVKDTTASRENVFAAIDENYSPTTIPKIKKHIAVNFPKEKWDTDIPLEPLTTVLLDHYQDSALPTNAEKALLKFQFESSKQPTSTTYDSLSDVCKTPLQGAFEEAMRDIDFTDQMPGKGLTNLGITNLALFGSFGALAVPHELIHAGVNKLTGGTNSEIVLNQIYAGGLIDKFSDSIESKLMLPFLGGYVKIEEYGSTLGAIATNIAPYAMTPLCMAAYFTGRDKKNLPLTIAGVGALGGHVSGTIGDFWNIGKLAIYQTCETIAQLGGSPDFIATENPTTAAIGGVLGLVLGYRLMSFTYRLSKAGVNTILGKTGNSLENSI